VYALGAAVVAWRLGGYLLRHPDGSLLLAAVALFGLAIVFDVADLPWLPMRAFAEAAAQLFGGLCWAAFALRASWRGLQTWVALASPRREAALDRRERAAAA
jgi:hypothetical protein